MGGTRIFTCQGRSGTAVQRSGCLTVTDQDAAILHAEVAALQAVIISVLRRLAARDSGLAPLLCDAFDDAEAVLTGLAFQLGASIASSTTVEALRVVEEIRAGALRNTDCATTSKA